MAEAPIRVLWKTARKRSRQKKERIEMRNFGQILIKNQQKIQEELSDLRDTGAGSVKTLSTWLESSLTFKKVKDVGNNPFLQLPSAEGARISKKMSYVLRHNLPHGQYSPQDGSVPIFALEKSLSLPREKILLATSPMYDEERSPRCLCYHPSGSTWGSQYGNSCSPRALLVGEGIFEAALPFGPQYQCSQRHFISRVYLAATEERRG